MRRSGGQLALRPLRAPPSPKETWMTGTALDVPDPRFAGKPGSLHPGGEPLPAADRRSRRSRSAARWQADDDIDAARQLVLSHLRLVVAVSRNYLGYGLPQADLIQEGNVGLMKAVRRFDPERGVRLVSFALHWIRAEIHEYILRNWRLVKVATTKAQRKLFFNLRSMKARSAALSTTEADDDREGPRRQARGSRSRWRRASRGHDIALDPHAGRRRRRRRADRLPDRQRRRAGADPRARSRRSATAPTGLQARARQARRPQPPHHRGALAARGRSRRRCRSSPTSTACPPSASARSKARR